MDSPQAIGNGVKTISAPHMNELFSNKTYYDSRLKDGMDFQSAILRISFAFTHVWNSQNKGKDLEKRIR